MFHKAIDVLTKADIETLIAEKISERKTLEYKEILPGTDDEAIKDFLADASSLANTAGGYIVFGIKDKRDDKGRATGVPEAAPGIASTNLDIEKRRLDDLLRNRAEPPIVGTQFKQIDGFERGPVIVMQVAKSWNAPHMVKHNGGCRFYTRREGGRIAMELPEIRAAFTMSETLTAKLSAFRSDRISKILTDDTPVKLSARPRVVFHAIPIANFANKGTVDLNLYADDLTDFVPFAMPPGDMRFNIDGVVRYRIDTDEKAAAGYIQGFRNGMLESVNARLFIKTHEVKHMDVKGLEIGLMQMLRRTQSLFQKTGSTPPFLVMVSLLDAAGFSIHQRMSFHPAFRELSIDRQHVLLPELYFETYPENIGKALRPMFDAIWNAAGYDSCPHYDNQGNWSDQI